MGLAPLEIHDDPRRDPNKEIHVFESHNDIGNACITVIAVVEGVERKPRMGLDDDVREWTAYWMAFTIYTTMDRQTTGLQKEDRVKHTRDRGNKIPRQVAEAMFPQLSDYYFRE
jgi:hypothetical protein